mmetsp:Transcript_34559/g.88436  ORF Transcript_34559/g.88436 Transcript_34559/m.88436 type:complete len:867 (-) Transcript_34559:73-2673(-)|eukprot:jgi/Tetstr1/434756/TSEL_023807.t1
MGKTDGFNCFGIKTASEVRVKRYNLLVPDIFPPIEPEYKKELPNGIQRKIKKLGEYLEKYPERSEKVSRRLDRRLRKDLPNERFGHVQVAVHAYIQLLKGGQAAATQFAKELLGDEDDAASVGVIPMLLNHRRPELRTWAVKLIAQFINAQDDSRFKDRIEDYLDDLCSMCHLTQDSPECHGISSETLEGMRAAGLLSLNELLALNSRTQAIPSYLEQIEDCALENLYYHHDTKMSSIQEGDPASDTEAAGSSIMEPHAATTPPQGTPRVAGAVEKSPPSGSGPPHGNGVESLQGGGASVSAMKRSEKLRKVDTQLKEVGTKMRQSMVRMKTKMMDRRAKGAKQAVHADEMAAELLEDLAEFAQDSSTRRRLLENMFRFCDARQHWSSPDKIEACVSIFRKSCVEDHQYFVLFSSFVRHLASQRLSGVDRATLIKMAAAEGELQQSAFAAPTLAFALSELPQYLPNPADSSDKVFLRTSILMCLRRLAAALSDSASVLEAVQAPLERMAQPTSVALANLQCAEVAVSVVPSLPQQTHDRVFPQALLDELIVVATSWKEAGSRAAAHSIMQAVLSCSALRRSQMEALLSSCWYQLLEPESAPEVMVRVFATLGAALDGAPVEVAKLAVPFAIAVHSRSLQKPPAGSSEEGPSPARRLACLLVADLLFERLSQQLLCPGLIDLSAGAEEHSNAVEAETPSSLTAAEPSFTPEHDAAAAGTLEPLARAATGDAQLMAAQALANGGFSEDVLNPPWVPVGFDRLCRPGPPGAVLSNRFSVERQVPRVDPGEEVLRSVQANFASLAITTEDVLMTGAVGVGSLVEAAKQSAMEMELALRREPADGQKRSFQQMVESAVPTSMSLDSVLADL